MGPRMLLIVIVFLYASKGILSYLPTFLMINAGQDIRLVNFFNDSKTYNSTILVSKVYFGLVLGIDVEARLVFYVNGKEQLVVLPIDNPQDATPTSLTLLDLPEALCVDWVTKKVYWSDRETNRIEFLSYASFLTRRPHERINWRTLRRRDDSFIRRSVVNKNLTLITGLCIDPIKGYLFYVNSHFDAQTIERIWLDGSHRATVHRNGRGGIFVTALTVDVRRARLYACNGSIFSLNYDGSDRRLVVGHSSLVASMIVFDDFIFWSSETDGIFYAHISPGGPTVAHRLVADMRADILRIFDTRVQMLPAEKGVFNPCLEQNDCSDICLYVPEAPFRSCVCPTGYKLLPDKRVCAENMSKVILFARRNDIRLISLDTDDFTDQILISGTSSTRNSVAIEYDHKGGYVYWSDNELKAIKRAKLDGSDERTIILNEAGTLDGMAIDWVAGNLYWTDAQASCIEVARLDGSIRRVIVSQDLQKPRGIAIDPLRGVFYWSDWFEDEPRIEQAFLDGTNRRIFLSLDREYLPNGLALDVVDTRSGDKTFLYYADARSDEIWRVNANDANDRRLVYNSTNTHAFGLALLDDYLYWTDWSTRKIMRVEKWPLPHNKATVLQAGLADLMGIKAVDLEHPPSGTNPCAYENNACSHFCFYLPTGAVCDCPADLELMADKKTCAKPLGYLTYSVKGYRNNIMRISMTSSASRPFDLLLRPLENLFSIDYLWKDQTLFYVVNVNLSQGKIYKSSLNGGAQNPEIVIDNGFSLIHSLAIDWLAGNIYFSDIFYNAIHVARANGRHRRTIVWGAVQPRALAVHPVAGHLYWSDDLDFSIKRCDLDGSSILTIVNYASEHYRITSLTIDCRNNILYYVVDGAIDLINLTHHYGVRSQSD